MCPRCRLFPLPALPILVVVIIALLLLLVNFYLPFYAMWWTSLWKKQQKTSRQLFFSFSFLFHHFSRSDLFAVAWCTECWMLVSTMFALPSATNCTVAAIIDLHFVSLYLKLCVFFLFVCLPHSCLHSNFCVYRQLTVVRTGRHLIRGNFLYFAVRLTSLFFAHEDNRFFLPFHVIIIFFVKTINKNRLCKDKKANNLRR